LVTLSVTVRLKSRTLLRDSFTVQRKPDTTYEMYELDGC
jgi:hypothetical protein